MTDLRGFFLTLDRWHQRLVPVGAAEIEKAVATLRLRMSLTVPTPALTALLTPFFGGGWCLAAVEHAVRWRPNGLRQPVFSDLGGSSHERSTTRGWLLERQLAKWRTKDGAPLPPPVEAQLTEDAYRVHWAVLERNLPGALPDSAAHARRREVMAAFRKDNAQRTTSRRRDRVAEVREADRRVRSAMGELARLAGMHEADNVTEFRPPRWRNEAHRRQQQSERMGAERSGYQQRVARLRDRVEAEGPAAYTPELKKVVARDWRDARTEASLAYLEQLAADITRAG